VFLAVLVALVAVAAAIATTPVGQDWGDSLRGWLGGGYDWARGTVT